MIGAFGLLDAQFAANQRARSPMAQGRILGAAEETDAESALDRRYGLRRRLYVKLGTRLGVQSVYLELTPTGLDHE